MPNTSKPAYLPASGKLPDDLCTALEFATLCLAMAAGGRAAIDPDGLLLPRPVTESSLRDRIPKEFADQEFLAEWCNVNAPAMADLAAAYRSMERKQSLKLFSSVSGHPTTFTCWHEAALSCRPSRGLEVDDLRDIWTGCRAEAAEALRIRTSEAAAFTFSPDYRSLRWGWRSFSFTKTQAACVKALWEHRQRGVAEMHQVAILEAAGSKMVDSKEARVGKLFRESEAWGVVIVKGRAKGTFRLADPDS